MTTKETDRIPGASETGQHRGRRWIGADHPGYKWVALTNTTVGMLIATINSSIVLISLPGIFTGIRLDPLEPANVSYLLWMLMGYMLVTAVLVVALGRLGDMMGRVRIYNAGFLIFTITSVILSLDPFHGGSGALWLIGWRIVQAIGGSMLMANSAAILTDAFPARQRGMALGVNMVAGIAGSFLGLVLGGVLVTWNWRSIFWVNVPIGLIGTVWAYKSLHETGIRRPGRMDWWGNITFAIGLTALLAGITYGIQPYGGHTMGWTNPWVLAGLIGGAVMLVVFCLVEAKVSEPMFPLRLFRDAAFAGGNAATLLGAIARGGLQFMLIIWLQGIWLPLHGYDYADTPLWAGIYMLPLTIGFLLAGPLSGALSDKFGARLFAACGFLVMAVSFAGLLVLPSDFSYWVFAALIFLNGLGGGLFAAPNTAIIMSSVPADARGAASGMRATFQNAGMVLSMGVFFSLMVAGLAGTLPDTLTTGLTAQGVPAGAAHTVSQLPPVGVLFAAFLGYNPIQHLLGPDILGHLSPSAAAHLTGREFFPHLISQPFHDGLVVVFSLAIAMSLAAVGASLIRGRRTETVAAGSPSPAPDSHPATTAPTTTSAPSTGVLRGRVHDSAGRPIARASLTLVDRSGRQRALASTGADGTYELTTREPSSYTLVVSATGHHPRAVQLDAEAGPVVPDVTLAGLGSVNGTVRHEHTGEPVPDAQITLLSSSGEVVASAATNPDGTYTLQNLAPGAYTVVTSGYGPVLADVTLDEGNSRVVDLEVGHHDTD
ncbi:Putative multidrug resistance protein MdtD [Streptomyces griseofuscus]|uniref:Multidrug resistance protein MdtD n=1 Tax=Streptomyces griseofuscus TaxID=146922 RepID=A0A7H1PS57_9ACTN|nr:Putative multidrug resistance protein MdtD [Streptomyces griseofuscus]